MPRRCAAVPQRVRTIVESHMHMITGSHAAQHAMP